MTSSNLRADGLEKSAHFKSEQPSLAAECYLRFGIIESTLRLEKQGSAFANEVIKIWTES